jgi:hypothetical protein
MLAYLAAAAATLVSKLLMAWQLARLDELFIRADHYAPLAASHEALEYQPDVNPRRVGAKPKT